MNFVSSFMALKEVSINIEFIRVNKSVFIYI